eukprot:scaffold24311_cov114-Isochrysis_galbana.AAC.2
MGAAITYLLLDLEGVDTEPDILDDGKKGPWTIFATADCAEQFKAKYGDKIVLTFSEIPIEFTITYYGEIQAKNGGSSNEKSNARALASALALADATTHLVVKINDKSIANRQPGQPLPPQQRVQTRWPQDGQGQSRKTQDQHPGWAHQHLRQKVRLASLRDPDDGPHPRLQLAPQAPPRASSTRSFALSTTSSARAANSEERTRVPSPPLRPQGVQGLQHRDGH